MLARTSTSTASFPMRLHAMLWNCLPLLCLVQPALAAWLHSMLKLDFLTYMEVVVNILHSETDADNDHISGCFMVGRLTQIWLLHVKSTRVVLESCKRDHLACIRCGGSRSIIFFEITTFGRELKWPFKACCFVLATHECDGMNLKQNIPCVRNSKANFTPSLDSQTAGVCCIAPSFQGAEDATGLFTVFRSRPFFRNEGMTLNHPTGGFL